MERPTLRRMDSRIERQVGTDDLLMLTNLQRCPVLLVMIGALAWAALLSGMQS